MTNSFQSASNEQQPETPVTISADTKVGVDGSSTLEIIETFEEDGSQEDNSDANRSGAIGVIDLYEGADFKGRKVQREFFEFGRTYRFDVSRLGIHNDSLSSAKTRVRTGHNMQVYFYDNAGFSGQQKYHVFSDGSDYLNYIGNDCSYRA
ncbi:hypothetical protein IQ274_28670 [Nostoc sp. LEGE 12447]|uniref:hypothetical protein n=1 Tax=Nostoc sp. LEGE 12447 TaxID=1828640 RepID=UPI0018839F2B|nr:hypothetical protein [Nostoc sp. LEGE 12447]MBE9002068.1 hypothetical protein [Nostoc sp. LEGE 12447]